MKVGYRVSCIIYIKKYIYIYTKKSYIYIQKEKKNKRKNVFHLLIIMLHEGDGDWVAPPVPAGPYKGPAPKEQKSGAGWR